MPYFPDNINTFVDLFCGAGNVGINVDANKIYLNDYINYLPDMFKAWKGKSIEEIEKYIEETINKFNLSPHNDAEFKEFRKHYNTYKNIEDLFILICYSFNYQMRFNNSQQYNSSFGKTASTMNGSIRNNLKNFVNALHTKNITPINKDFRELKTNKLGENDFVYCDPPYSITCGVYQDGKRGFKGWSKQDDLDLFELLDKLDEQGVKFAMSNMTESKGNVNEELLKWASKYNVHYLNMNYNGCNYQRKIKSKDKEVLITNYDEGIPENIIITNPIVRFRIIDKSIVDEIKKTLETSKIYDLHLDDNRIEMFEDDKYLKIINNRKNLRVIGFNYRDNKIDIHEKSFGITAED